jgi:hypothetical protein
MIPEITIYLSRFWGSLFMILGVSTIFAGFLGRVIEYTKDKTITISTGYITFLLGLFTAVFHQLWVFDWRVSVTLLGWITLFKGIEKIAFPERVHKKAQMFKKMQWLWGIIIFFIGLWFFWMSFY